MCDGRNDDLDKGAWRARLSAARAAVPAATRDAEAWALAHAIGGMRLPPIVCCYVPFGSEPGSVALLDVARQAGARVLLPVIPAQPGPLDWAEYTGAQTLSPGRVRGILEPTGPRLGPAALGDAGLVLIPALAVDSSGVRLGRGAGHYDRSLGHAAPDAALVAVVRDAELVERLPAEPHDVRMTAALTPRLGLVPLPR
ncbi:5-formyltetrahydrofolate cyclo-ligase [Amycolatopsis bartoniae]|uniref:5-formyltetrahydrofolate cyclo-ligase n=1 Tax=Amycolatopsis bartoniae TaxID=941986 RepID=A0A8H9M8U6_9PSEU|nr:5-formyltetrahydrofolate cyclo-ligase [Amycolatopsis bartoniae]MBB2934802.1 5-formyltetrahydrofolate cyclo-ligase [Amycolatopsis bartoniae]TVT02412.1 5-formyltetrahydrofolate cyclo-ligase [Amycolatopsis bartoniae]GHF44637.1 5-formyltetrahydrofolate cyclo-ligase [Amycolatopsis bartoniae]